MAIKKSLEKAEIGDQFTLSYHSNSTGKLQEKVLTLKEKDIGPNIPYRFRTFDGTTYGIGFENETCIVYRKGDSWNTISDSVISLSQFR